MTRLDAKRYSAICGYAGEWLVTTPFQRFDIDQVGDLEATGCAVYVVDDAFGEVDYVGSVCRTSDVGGVRRRLSEHLRDPEKRRRWHRVAIVKLRPDTPLEVVRTIEAAIGTDLLPKKNQRLPRLLR